MKETADKIRVLSALEVKLSMEILGVKNWEYFPVLETEDPLEKRVMTAFLHLVDMGFMRPQDGGYNKTEQMEQTFSEAKHPDYTLQILKKNSMPMVISGNLRRAVVFEQISVQDGMLRVYHSDADWIWSYMKQLPEKVKPGKQVDAGTVRKKMTDADMIMKLYKENKSNMLYIWETREGTVYLKDEETRPKFLDKDTFLQLLEE